MCKNYFNIKSVGAQTYTSLKVILRGLFIYIYTAIRMLFIIVVNVMDGCCQLESGSSYLLLVKAIRFLERVHTTPWLEASI